MKRPDITDRIRAAAKEQRPQHACECGRVLMSWRESRTGECETCFHRRQRQNQLEREQTPIVLAPLVN